MGSFAGLRPALCALLLALTVLPLAAQTASGPHRRGADPSVVRALQAHTWTLQSATEASGQPVGGLIVPGHAFVLHFQDAQLSVQGGCNTMNGSWRLSPQGQLMVGRLASTMKACEAPLMQADAALSALLGQHLSVQLSGGPPVLRLSTPMQQQLVLTGEATLESRYGAPRRMFLEVAPQTVPCQPGAGAPTQCLQVRERRFDKQGLRIEPPGEWRAFYGQILGYTHTPGVRNVVRVNRYERKQVPADASRYIYVLDLVVESETAAK